MGKVSDRLFAILLLAAGVASLVRAFFLLRDYGSDGFLSADGTAFHLPISLAVAFMAGVICLAAALMLWTGRWSGRTQQGEARAAPLFGRNVDAPRTGSPGLRRLLFILPVIALAALAADRLGLLQTPLPEVVAEKPAPTEPTAPEPKQVESAPIPMPTPVPEPAEPLPSAPEKAPPPEEAVAPVQPAPEPAEAVVPPSPAPPPETVAPLPKIAPQPTQADGHRDAVVWLALSPDGHSLLSASTDRVIKLWDLDNRHLLRNLGTHKDMARTALFLPDGARALTAGDDGEIVLRSVADGAVLHVFSAGQNGGANKLAITPDGRRAVSVHEAGTVIVWDIDKGAVLHVLSGHSWPITSVAISPDGGRAISGSIDGELRLWDIDNGRLLRTWLGHERGTYGAAFTADGHHAVTGSGDRSIKLWDLDTGREVLRFDGHSGTVYALAISSDGKRLLSASLDGTARLWDMASGDQLAMFDPGTGPIYSVAFTADGSVLTGGIDRSIRLWPAGGGEGVVLFPGAPD